MTISKIFIAPLLIIGSFLQATAEEPIDKGKTAQAPVAGLHDFPIEELLHTLEKKYGPLPDTKRNKVLTGEKNKSHEWLKARMELMDRMKAHNALVANNFEIRTYIKQIVARYEKLIALLDSHQALVENERSKKIELRIIEKIRTLLDKNTDTDFYLATVELNRLISNDMLAKALAAVYSTQPNQDDSDNKTHKVQDLNAAEQTILSLRSPEAIKLVLDLCLSLAYWYELDSNEFLGNSPLRPVNELEELVQQIKTMLDDKDSGLSNAEIGAFTLEILDPSKDKERILGYHPRIHDYLSK